ncbi:MULTISPECIES: LysR family transcriptional regulator [unclassified Brevibacterium]|uniref:LysR family transcriptional regulator n=1 Tax=unclassified Brevibacterium TaxID=2614124 RepID=UPI0010F44E96|nr:MULTISPECIES: LysR family transcriptional regulator [unclassified Brevibacterium]MCM1013673.1 LysR family transcriptional regulator [Brevibacterium sp. XM4083]
MSDITLRQLEYFLAALDDGSITAAARTCSVTQATVSTALNELERAVGTRLLVRSRTAGVRPTSAGTALVSRARAMLDLAREIPDVAMGDQSTIVGLVRVGCIFPLGPYLLPQLISDFAEAHPELDISFVEGATGDLRRELDVGRLDLVLTFGGQLPPTVPAQEIASFRQMILLAADHPLAGRKEIAFRDVAEMPVILFNQPPSRDRVEAMIRGAGVEPDVRWESASPETVRGLVRRGLGYSVGNIGSEAEGRDSDDGIAYIPIDDPQAPNSIVAVYETGHPVPRRVSSIVDYFIEQSPTWEWLSE